jgi:hypothetical protein
LIGTGSLPVVRVFDVATGREATPILAYNAFYNHGVRTAVGDLNGDGFLDIVTATRTGTGAIRVWDGLTHQRFTGALSQIDAFTGRSAHGAYVALSDVNGDGTLDIVAGSGLGGGAVKVFNGKTGKLLKTENPFGPQYAGGVRVAGGDVNGDGIGDIVAGQGALGSKVRISFGGSEAPRPVTFNAGAPKLRDGVFVTAADTTGDGIAEIVVGRGAEGGKGRASVGIFTLPAGGATPELTKTIGLSSIIYRFGARVGATDLNGDGLADIITGAGPLGGSRVQFFNGFTGGALGNLTAFGATPKLGVFVAAGAPPGTVRRG